MSCIILRILILKALPDMEHAHRLLKTNVYHMVTNYDNRTFNMKITNKTYLVTFY